MITQRKVLTKYAMKKNWEDFKIEKREIATKKRLGDYLDTLSLLNEDITIEILKENEKEYSQVFTIKEYLEEKDGLTRKELFHFITSIDEDIEEIATGEYTITYKLDEKGEHLTNEKGEFIIDKKVAEIITNKRYIQIVIE